MENLYKEKYLFNFDIGTHIQNGGAHHNTLKVDRISGVPQFQWYWGKRFGLLEMIPSLPLTRKLPQISLPSFWECVIQPSRKCAVKQTICRGSGVEICFKSSNLKIHALKQIPHQFYREKTDPGLRFQSILCFRSFCTTGGKSSVRKWDLDPNA